MLVPSRPPGGCGMLVPGAQNSGCCVTAGQLTLPSLLTEPCSSLVSPVIAFSSSPWPATSAASSASTACVREAVADD